MKYQLQYVYYSKKKDLFRLIIIETFEINRIMKHLERLSNKTKSGKSNVIAILVTKFRKQPLFFDDMRYVYDVKDACPKFRYIKEAALENMEYGNTSLLVAEIETIKEKDVYKAGTYLGLSIKDVETMFEECERKLVRFIPNSSDLCRN